MKIFIPTANYPNSRREFLPQCDLLAMAVVWMQIPRLSWATSTQPVKQSVLQNTVNGLLAFVVPGSDVFSVHQGQGSQESG